MRCRLAYRGIAVAKSSEPKATKGKSKSKVAPPPLRTGPASQGAASGLAPAWALNDDRKSATATFSDNPPVYLNYDVAAVEELQKSLGAIRGAMVPEVAAAPGENEQIAAIANPSWVIRPARTSGDCLLQLRDPRFGWLHYFIPKAEAAKLLDFLTKHVGSGA